MPPDAIENPESAALPPQIEEPRPTVFQSVARWAFSFPALLIFGLIVATVLTSKDGIDDPDVWWHLKVGEIIWETHSIPRADLFSHTTGNHPWIPHEWLAQLSLYGAYKLGGYSGLILWLSLFGSAVVVLVYALCWLRSGNAKVALFGGMAAWLFATIGLAVRPLVLGHLFLAAELLVLELARKRSMRWLWLLPPIFALWVNCHGSYALGLVVLGIYGFCSFIDVNAGALASSPWAKADRVRLGLVSFLCLAALFVNPAGPRLVAYPLNLFFQQSTNTTYIVEWQPLTVSDGRGVALFLVLGIVFAVMIGRRARIYVEECLLLLVGTGLALRHGRMAFAFGILAAPLLCRLLQNVGSSYRPERDMRFANAALMLAGAGAMVFAFPSPAALQDKIAEQNPSAAVSYIRSAGLSGPMLNAYDFGGYLIWALPEHKTFVDGRADIFDWTGVLAEYVRWAHLSEDPSLLLDKHRIGFCLVRSSDPVARVLQYLPGWSKAYGDGLATVFVRSGAPNAGRSSVE
jgi:hypothetical protein